MSVQEAQQKVDPVEFHWWFAYDRVEPIGPDRVDYQFAILTATLANCHRSKNQRAYKPQDFLPEWGTADKPDANKRMQSVIQHYAARVNKVYNGSNRRT